MPRLQMTPGSRLSLAVVRAAARPVATLAGASVAQEKPPEPVVALVGATFIDGTGPPPLANTTVLMQGKRIRAVGSATAIRVPPGAQKIDVTGKFILAGFIDCHIHAACA